MSNVYLDDSLLTGIGNAIRAKAGTSGLLTPAQMATAIANIPTGGGGNVRAIGDCRNFIHSRRSFTSTSAFTQTISFPLDYYTNDVNSDYDDYIFFIHFKDSSSASSYTITLGGVTPDYSWVSNTMNVAAVNCQARVNAWKLSRLFTAKPTPTFANNTLNTVSLTMYISDATSNNLNGSYCPTLIFYMSIKKGITLDNFGVYDLGTGYTTAAALADAAKQYQPDDVICDIPWFIGPNGNSSSATCIWGNGISLTTMSMTASAIARIHYGYGYKDVLARGSNMPALWHTTATQTSAITSSYRYACLGMPRANWS